MATLSSQLAVIKFGSIAAPTTLVEFSNRIRDVEWDFAPTTTDTTAIGDEGIEMHADIPSEALRFTFKPTLENGLYVLTNARNINNVQIGVEVNPFGTASGRPKYTGRGILIASTIGLNVARPVAISGGFHMNPAQADGSIWTVSTN